MKIEIWKMMKKYIESSDDESTFERIKPMRILDMARTLLHCSQRFHEFWLNFKELREAKSKINMVSTLLL